MCKYFIYYTTGWCDQVPQLGFRGRWYPQGLGIWWVWAAPKGEGGCRSQDLSREEQTHSPGTLSLCKDTAWFHHGHSEALVFARQLQVHPHQQSTSERM